MVVVVEFSVIPVGEGVSLSKLIAHAVKVLEEKEVKHLTTPMGTILEAKTLSEALRYVEMAHEAIFEAGAKRVVTLIKVDERRDVERSMENKLKSLKKSLEELERSR